MLEVMRIYPGGVLHSPSVPIWNCYLNKVNLLIRIKCVQNNPLYLLFQLHEKI